MGYNWAGIGSALGQGLNQGVMGYLAPKMELSSLKQKIDYLQTLPADQRALALQMMGKQPDPMTQLANMMALGMSGAGGQQPPFDPYSAPQAPQGPGLKSQPNVPPLNGMSKGQMRVRLISTGEIGTIPSDEFDPNVYEKVSP